MPVFTSSPELSVKPRRTSFVETPGFEISQQSPLSMRRRSVSTLSTFPSPFFSTGVSESRTPELDLGMMRDQADCSGQADNFRAEGLGLQIDLDDSFHSPDVSPANREYSQNERRELTKQFIQFENKAAFLLMGGNANELVELYNAVAQYGQDNHDFLHKNGLLSDAGTSKNSLHTFNGLLAHLFARKIIEAAAQQTRDMQN